MHNSLFRLSENGVKGDYRNMFNIVSVEHIRIEVDVLLARAEPRIWVVDDDGPADFNAIQEVVNAASDGDFMNPFSEIPDITPVSGESSYPSWIDVTSVVLGIAIVVALFWKLNVSKKAKKKRPRKMLPASIINS